MPTTATFIQDWIKRPTQTSKIRKKKDEEEKKLLLLTGDISYTEHTPKSTELIRNTSEDVWKRSTWKSSVILYTRNTKVIYKKGTYEYI